MITRVYGTADKHEIEFINQDGVWCAAVPSDFTDGKYVVELWAIDSHGFTAYYTGILYIFDGNATIDLTPDDVIFGFYSDGIYLIDSIKFNLINDEIYLILISCDMVGDLCEN